MVRANGSKAWVQRITIDGDRTDLGLGGYPDLPLALARTKSAELRTAVAEGRDPRAERRQPNLPTFQDAAEQYISDNAALPKTPAVKAHFRALPYQDVPDTLKKIEASTASLASRLCFRVLVLTTARSGEARGARWDEIDLDARTWTIPASRMKAGVEHRVPLSDAALGALRRAKALDDNSGLMFPSPMKSGSPLSDMTLTKLLRDNGLAETATVHGFRTSFRTWAMWNVPKPRGPSERRPWPTPWGPVPSKPTPAPTCSNGGGPLMEAWCNFVADI